MLQAETLEEFKTRQGRKLLLETSPGFTEKFIIMYHGKLII